MGDAGCRRVPAERMVLVWGSTWTTRTLSPIMVLCGESDADSTLLAISQLATHHYALSEMWRAGSALVTA
ncbi:hypothetical protein PBY51_022450 [Eleginops maclovinus]|uniref:Uncharacterized protein n=1 Tax=Eleginops maclovinus TaxID=56733 RepID=A0AAN7XFA6_ELEMC|nr:hypothetical protein PBY51_022450 [Eleginops maclovinus]